MVRSQYSGKTAGAVAGILIASICILVYLGALVSVIIRINTSMEHHSLIAEQEFFDLADLAASAGVLSFMDETYIAIIQSALNESRTLEGVIISGPSGEYGFEKEAGKALDWVNNSPRFKSRLRLSRQTLYLPLRIQGLRNVNIQAVAGILDYADLSVILKQAMILIASALALAFFTLLIGSLNKKDKIPKRAADKRINEAGEKSHTSPAKQSYSQRSHVTRQEFTESRLTEELGRCAAAESDLAFIIMEYKPATDDGFYARFAADAARFFSSRDFICEKGERGVSIICPGLSLDAGFLNADEFHTRILGKYPGLFTAKTDLCIGLSACSGRPVNAERLMFEAEEALERAMMDPVSHIVAFKSDPEKYRQFMETKT